MPIWYRFQDIGSYKDLLSFCVNAWLRKGGDRQTDTQTDRQTTDRQTKQQKDYSPRLTETIMTRTEGNEPMYIHSN